MDCRTCRHANEWAPGHYECTAPWPAWATRYRRPLPRIWVEDDTVYFDRPDYGKTVLTGCGAHLSNPIGSLDSDYPIEG